MIAHTHTLFWFTQSPGVHTLQLRLDGHAVHPATRLSPSPRRVRESTTYIIDNTPIPIGLYANGWISGGHERLYIVDAEVRTGGRCVYTSKNSPFFFFLRGFFIRLYVFMYV